MSAYIVETDTIRAIVTFAMGGRQRVGTVRKMKPTDEAGIGDYTNINTYAPEQVGQNLLAENYASVNYRYNGTDDCPAYRHRDTIAGYVSPTDCHVLTPIDIIKLCDCLQYQSCEHPGWERSWACDFLRRVRDAALYALPGYDDAPWGLYRATTPAKSLPISLSSLTTTRKAPR